jgi:hypothetical protein
MANIRCSNFSQPHCFGIHHYFPCPCLKVFLIRFKSLRIPSSSLIPESPVVLEEQLTSFKSLCVTLSRYLTIFLKSSTFRQLQFHVLELPTFSLSVRTRTSIAGSGKKLSDVRRFCVAFRTLDGRGDGSQYGIFCSFFIAIKIELRPTRAVFRKSYLGVTAQRGFHIQYI